MALLGKPEKRLSLTVICHTSPQYQGTHATVKIVIKLGVRIQTSRPILPSMGQESGDLGAISATELINSRTTACTTSSSASSFEAHDDIVILEGTGPFALFKTTIAQALSSLDSSPATALPDGTILSAPSSLENVVIVVVGIALTFRLFSDRSPSRVLEEQDCSCRWHTATTISRTIFSTKEDSFL